MKELVWIGSTRSDVRALPSAVRRTFGVALFAVQNGDTPTIAKPMKGFGGADVLELKDDDRSGAYRTVYTVRFGDAVYVLHVFQKKSKHGIQTPRREVDLIRQRLKRADEIHRSRR